MFLFGVDRSIFKFDKTENYSQNLNIYIHLTSKKVRCLFCLKRDMMYFADFFYFLFWCILVRFVVPGFISWLWNRDGGLAVMSLQLHLHCDGLLILLTQTQLLLSPENKYNTCEKKDPSVTGQHRIISVKRNIGLLIKSPFPSKKLPTNIQNTTGKPLKTAQSIQQKKIQEAKVAFMNSPPVMAEGLGVPPGDRTWC